MALADCEQKVFFLSQPENYPVRTLRVQVKETHLSWVFLTDAHAWKLKKPVRTDVLDFSTPEARRRNCETEVCLNRRLARDVYLGVVALIRDAQGKLSLVGKEQPVDWLVWMRRLPDERMLDQIIAHHAVCEAEIRQLGRTLADFYHQAAPVNLTAEAYCQRLLRTIRTNQFELTKPEYGLRVSLINAIAESQLQFLQYNRGVLAARANNGKIVEGHGDLRPEHICLEREPVIIDCLEFNRELRLLDPVSELAFLALECERLGASKVGERIFQEYTEQTGDHPPLSLLSFYQSMQACRCAKVAVWHLQSHEVVDRATWIGKANQYLKMAACFSTATIP
ncbi:MAG TPA: hypothetical protein VFZ34_26810 [Blastocatellia bacterium]|nr:hypothetical protein [Blastocatellia bacterium]